MEICKSRARDEGSGTHVVCLYSLSLALGRLVARVWGPIVVSILSFVATRGQEAKVRDPLLNNSYQFLLPWKANFKRFAPDVLPFSTHLASNFESKFDLREAHKKRRGRSTT